MKFKRKLEKFHEGDPSATAALQGDLHLTTNISSVKCNAKSKNLRKTIIMPKYNDNSGYRRYTKKKEKIPVL